MMIYKAHRCLIAIFCLVLVLILNWSKSPNLSNDLLLNNKLTELIFKLEHLQTNLYAADRKEIQLLTYQLLQLTDIAHLPPNLQYLINTSNNTSIKLPTAFSFIPHLLKNLSSLRPAYLNSKGRSGVNMVLGIPHIKREKHSYLLHTLKELLDNMNSEEMADTLIIVFVAETDIEYVINVAKQIEVQFPNELETGVIEIISPHPSYYPDFSKLYITLGDNHKTVTWRSKQNLDFAFLMSYAQTKGMFYVQLEDDVLAKKNFITTMKSFVSQQISEKRDWAVLDFCHLGFIGKLFKTVDLPKFVQFFILFYNDKPVDWLLEDFFYTKVCSLEWSHERCVSEKDKFWLLHSSSLFQHIGIQSSLKGKLQLLKDRRFGNRPLYYPHQNPDAIVESSIKSYNKFTIYNAYKGKTYFRGLSYKSGDYISFKFARPIFIKKYLFRSGNAEFPDDIFENTTVEIMPQNKSFIDKNASNVSEDGYIIIGKFDLLGIAQGFVNPDLGRISEFRLTLHSESNSWLILSEVHKRYH